MRGRMVTTSVALCAACAAVPAPSVAQGAAGRPVQTSPDSAREVGARAAELLEQIRILRALAQGRFSRETLEAMRDVVAAGYARLGKGDQQAVTELAGGRPLLSKAKATVIGNNSLDAPTPEEIAVVTTRERLESQRAAFLRQLAEELRKILQAAGQPDQAAALAAGTALVRDRRADEGPGGGAPGGFGGRGGPGGGADRTAQAMDRLRSTTPQSYQRERLQFALRNAGIPMIGRGGGPGFGRGDPGFGRGGPGAGRGGPGQGPNLNDPAIQARLAPYLKMADELRGMSQAQYQQAREKLARQIQAARLQERINAPVSEADAVEALIRALVRPAGLAALEGKVGKAAPTAAAL